jgi:hypothetical protein
VNARRVFAASALLSLAACTDSSSHANAVGVLVDVSGTYVEEKGDVVTLMKRAILPELEPGDSLVVVRIDDRSFEKENIEATLHLDVRPSKANAQKLETAAVLDRFAARRDRANHTDIRGAMMLAADHLRETGAANRTLVIFSDLEEDLPKGMVRDLGESELEGVHVVAMNVKRLQADNANPAVYRERIAMWEKRVRGSGASDWTVVLDPERLMETLQVR